MERQGPFVGKRASSREKPSTRRARGPLVWIELVEISRHGRINRSRHSRKHDSCFVRNGLRIPLHEMSVPYASRGGPSLAEHEDGSAAHEDVTGPITIPCVLRRCDAT